MTRKEYTDYISYQIEKCKDVLIKKNDEYSSNDKVLHNFEVASILTDTGIKQALAGMMVKHTVSVYDLIKKNEIDPKIWEEKITDNINYLLILSAIIQDEVVRRCAE